MKIEILCSDGSPLGVIPSTIWGDSHRIGVGGSELALLTMCEMWAKDGHNVVLYNNPMGGNDIFEQRPVSAFEPNANRDVLITFRTPNPRAVPAKGKKVWWSCDQYTSGDYANYARFMEKIVCISPFHVNYFETTYGIKNALVIDIPVRKDDFLPYKDKEKVQNRIIFTSVPDRGLQNLWRIYPSLKKRIPDLSLVITSDYRLWGVPEPRNSRHVSQWMSYDGVEFIGAVPRQKYLEEICKAELMIYPGIYPELFCIAVAEAQYAGVVTITSAVGALSSTNYGPILFLDCEDARNDWAFIEQAYSFLIDREKLHQGQDAIMSAVSERFDPERIKQQWYKHVFEDKDE